MLNKYQGKKARRSNKPATPLDDTEICLDFAMPGAEPFTRHGVAAFCGLPHHQAYPAVGEHPPGADELDLDLRDLRIALKFLLS
jgi:hypothetical protein